MEALLEAVDVLRGAMATLVQQLTQHLTQAGGQEAFEALAAQWLALWVLVEERLAQLMQLQ